MNDFFTNPTSQELYEDRYKKGNETPQETICRVAEFCSTNDEEKTAFEDMMLNKLAYPAGRTMSNAGIGKHLTLNNCFVPYQVPNDMGEIYECVKIGALTHKAGGGTGYDFSLLSPKGTHTNNDAVASGVVSFMHSFDAETATIQQGNRRGANMGVLSVYHPDIMEFITAKSTDSAILKNFNMSVMVDDDFMRAVENNIDVFLHYPVYDEFGKIENNKEKWEQVKLVNAKEIWDAITRNAYTHGEPGVLFYDNMNKDNNTWYLENIVATNPCFTGDMKLRIYHEVSETIDDVEFFDLEGRDDVAVVSADGTISFDNKVWCSGIKDVVEVKFANNKTIKCTPNHVFMLNDGTECEAKDLKGKRVQVANTPSDMRYDSDYIKMGFIQGDANLTRLLSKAHKGIEVNIGYKDDDIRELFANEEFTTVGNRIIYLQGGWKDRLLLEGFKPDILPERTLPDQYKSWSLAQKASFLRGLFSANGCVVKGHRVQFKTTCSYLALELRRALSDFDILSNITTNKAHSVKFENGEYTCRRSYDICINRYDDILKFAKYIGFVHKYKNEALEELIKTRSPYVVSVTPCGTEPVYDFTENNNHWGIVNGVIAHNCSEYLAGTIYGTNPTTNKQLDPREFGGACNLGSIMLHNMVDSPFTSKANFNWDRLSYTVDTMVCMLDNIIDVNKFPVDIYENYQKNMRTIGLGATGLADCLAMLGLRYDSEEGRAFTDEIFENIAIRAYMKSISLAKEKGCFPFLDRSKFVNSGFIKKHIDGKYGDIWECIVDDILKYGIRNARLLSVAPCGTLSLVWGNNCSSGIEPIFSLEYDRKISVGGQGEDFAQIIKMRDYAYDVAKSSPQIIDFDVFTTATEMSVDDHINMLGVIAKHVDMSVSKTINIPTEYSFEDTQDVYMKCWKLGIKGCTIFRPNEIRQGILLTNNTNETTPNNLKPNDLPRGYVLDAADEGIGLSTVIHTGCGKVYLYVKFDPDNGEPYEIFVNKGSNGTCRCNIEGIARMTSYALRSGVCIEGVIDQLQSVDACAAYAAKRAKGGIVSKGTCCPSAIGYALERLNKQYKEMFVDCEEDVSEVDVASLPTVIINDDMICPECGEPLYHEGGCDVCRSCGYSHCG